MDLRGARALVTGASSGIGAGTAQVLAADGALLALSGRRGAVLEELADGIAARGGPRPVVFPADLRTRGAAAELGARASEALGGVDILVNSAGAFETGSAAGDDAAGGGLFGTDFLGPMGPPPAPFPGLLEQKRGASSEPAINPAVTPPP